MRPQFRSLIIFKGVLKGNTLLTSSSIKCIVCGYSLEIVPTATAIEAKEIHQ